MYTPNHFSETRTDILHAFIRSRSFATLITLSVDELEANSIPFVLSENGELGTLQAHVARANTMWKDFSTDTDSLVIFQGADAYISPSWYPTKQDHGKVVPTWNYATVHVYGKLKTIEDPIWLRQHLNELTNQHEATFEHPWKVDDAPQEFTDRLIGNIVGLELTITKITGKWKMSQNQPEQNRNGVVDGLTGVGNDESLEIAKSIQNSSPYNLT